MKFFKNLRNTALAMSTATAAMIPTAFAAGDPTGGVTANVSANKLIGEVVEIITSIALWIGVILLVWSVVMLILALKNEDADSKSRAIMLIAVSVALVALGGLLTPILNMFGIYMT